MTTQIKRMLQPCIYHVLGGLLNFQSNLKVNFYLGPGSGKGT